MAEDFSSFENSDVIFQTKLEGLRRIVPDLILQSKTNHEKLSVEEDICRGYSEAQLRREIARVDLNRQEQDADKFTALLGEYERRIG